MKGAVEKQLDTSAARPGVPDRQVLNAADRLMLVAHGALREAGHGGFQCQSHVWLEGRLDVVKLQSALRRLAGAYPVVTSRIVEPPGRQPPYWRFRSDSRPQLCEIDLASDDPEEVRCYGARLDESPLDHDRSDPMSFHLLHRPSGRDVLILAYGHVLMDGKAPEFALCEVDRLYHLSDDEAPAWGAGASTVDEMAAHLARFDRRRRIRSALRVVASHLCWPITAVTLVPPEMREWQWTPFRFRVRPFDEAKTIIVRDRVKRLCGFANLTPAVLASAFRIISRLSPHRQSDRTAFRADLPLNLRPPGKAEPIFRNFMSFIQLSARRDEIANGDDAVRLLNGQMRDQIRRGIDLGNLQMMTFMAPRARALKQHIMNRMKNQPFTLGFGFLGPVAAGLERFCGAGVEAFHSFNTALSPPGITLQANLYQDRLNLILTYIGADAVRDATADALLAGMEEDMLG